MFFLNYRCLSIFRLVYIYAFVRLITRNLKDRFEFPESLSALGFNMGKLVLG